MPKQIHYTDLFSQKLLAEMLEGGYVTSEKHTATARSMSDSKLILLNYTLKAAIDREWNACTSNCRGLIVDSAGNVVARPFKKFFDLNTEWVPETVTSNLPQGVPVTITEKLDGTLGILYRAPDGGWAVATREGFASPAAFKATAMLRLRYNDADWLPGCTALFEIIYKEGRVVCQYNFDDLVLIGCINNETGEEMEYGKLCGLAEHNKMRVVEAHADDIQALAKQNLANKAGYIVTYDLGPRPPLKVKIRFEGYKNLLKAMSGVSQRSVWALLREDNVVALEALKHALPIEMSEKVNAWEHAFHRDYNKLALKCVEYFVNCPEDTTRLYEDEAAQREHRKKIARYFMHAPENWMKPVLFEMLVKKGFKKHIWDQLRPQTTPDAHLGAVEEV